MDQNDLEALLATLRQAQDGAAPAPAAPAAPLPAAPPPHQPATGAAPSQAQLDSLLSSLTALPSAHTTPPAQPAPSRTRDLSGLSFVEAVPLLNALALDGAFLERVQRVWDEQETWELRMKDERNRLEQELARAGTPPAIKAQRLREWDRAALRKWAALQAQQQEQLQALGIPTFQKTADPTLLKRQERVMSMLVGFLEDRQDGD
ncbi:hypothetical protein JCM10450v2_006829 [Rhodotorula kratochvilovae]